MAPAKRDPEISALDTIIGALEQLDDEARARVLDYAMRRLGMHELAAVAPTAMPSVEPVASREVSGNPSLPAPLAEGVTDIRSLREKKAPSTAMEMAALVAYYLSELAPEEERKSTVGTADLDKFFKQAGHPLPNRIGNTLPNAAAAGYFDTTAVRGEYKLNPVGYNLVTQTLPRGGAASRSTPRKRAAVKTAGAKKRKTATPAKRATKKRSA